ncbi:MAG: hypothetical protein FE834_03750 [Gammaproteobacteria bacterium]|nr:hypothetical protein [Gammaproteobacteria bacterium]
MTGSMVNMSNDMHHLGSYIKMMNVNIATMNQSMARMSGDMATMNRSMGAMRYDINKFTKPENLMIPFMR